MWILIRLCLDTKRETIVSGQKRWEITDISVENAMSLNVVKICLIITSINGTSETIRKLSKINEN